MLFAVLILGFSQLQATNPKKETVKFWVSMSCVSCQQKIMDNIPFEKGVKDMKVDLATKTVEVTFDTRKTDSEKIRSSIEKLGYEVRILKPGEDVQVAASGHSCSGHYKGDVSQDGCTSKNADHKCSGQKDPNHKCTAAQKKDANHTCTGKKDPNHKCTGHGNEESGNNDAHKCNHGAK